MLLPYLGTIITTDVTAARGTTNPFSNGHSTPALRVRSVGARDAEPPLMLLPSLPLTLLLLPEPPPASCCAALSLTRGVAALLLMMMFITIISCQSSGSVPVEPVEKCLETSQRPSGAAADAPQRNAAASPPRNGEWGT